MSIEAALREDLQRAERRELTIVTALPYVLLAICALVTVLAPIPVNLPATLGLTAAAAVWLALLRVPAARWFPHRGWWGAHYAGLLTLCAGLVVLAPWYGIVAFIGYVHAFLYLRGPWRYVGVAVTSAIMAVTYTGGAARLAGAGWWTWGAVAVVSTVLAATFFRFADTSYRHGDRRQQALDELHEANLRLETALEDNAGLHARLLVQARHAGMLDERQRIAREIHDTLAQGLAGILTQLQAAEQTLDDPHATRRHLQAAIDLSREGLAEARRTVHAVGPLALAEAGLPDALDELVRKWARTHDVDATLTVTGDSRPLHTDVETTLLRVAQEALANVAKHASAGRAGLTLSYMEDLVTLDVRDDGVGFEPAAVRGSGTADSGFGLTGMRRRAQRLAGRLDIETEPGSGTAISVSMPTIPPGESR